MTLLWGVITVLVTWAGLAWWRRRREAAADPHRRGAVDPRARPAPEDEGAIDWDALHEAEQDIKDVDAFQSPGESFTGDDWGPGTPRYGPPIR